MDHMLDSGQRDLLLPTLLHRSLAFGVWKILVLHDLRRPSASRTDEVTVADSVAAPTTPMTETNIIIGERISASPQKSSVLTPTAAGPTTPMMTLSKS
nr:unnamed protein product [Spirometra erinaceieuropaei]